MAKKRIKKRKIKNIKFYFIDIIPTTNKDGANPKTLKQIKKIRHNNEYPVFGSLKQRIKWRNVLSKGIQQKAKKFNLKFLKLEKEAFNKVGSLNESKSEDGDHITDLNLLQKIQKKI